MNKWHACLLLALAINCIVSAQVSMIDTIEVKANPIRQSNFGSQSIDLNKNNNIATSISNSSAVFIKNYGPGSLATSSIRGGSGSHTLVLWNDLAIQNPFLGLLDLSLLDTWAVNDIELQKGGNSAMWGSGAIGGSISLRQKNNTKSKFSFTNELTAASFGRIQEKAKISFKAGKFNSISSFSHLSARNDFPFTLSNGERRIQSNAQQIQNNFNQDIYYTPNAKNEFAFHYWRSRANRQNPPTTVQSRSEAFQIDRADRFALHWKHFGEKHQVRINAAYFVEELDYFDPLILTESLTDFATAIIDINDELAIGEHHHLSLGLSQYLTQVSSPSNYTSEVKESRTAFFATYRYKFVQLSGRQEYVDNQFIPFIPALSIHLPLHNSLALKGRISKNYRLPTLNDRFWENAGNPNLKPESGWSQELGLHFSKGLLTSSLTAFNRSIENWIQWTLLEGENLFKPYNLNRVWSRGVELDIKYDYNYLQLGGQYNYVKSTNTEALRFPKIEVGDQLFYTPIHNGLIRASLDFKYLIFTYRQQFASNSLGINENIDAYTIADFTTSLRYKNATLRLAILNIWNNSYRVIERRPMPGRSFEITLNLKINKE